MARVRELVLAARGPIGPELEGCILAATQLCLRKGAAASSARPDAVEQAQDLMRLSYAAPLSIADVAAAVGCSEGHLYRRFLARTGQTPVAWLTDLRLAHARHWLANTDWPIDRIARLVGYADRRYFARVFRQHAGQSPRAWRRAAAG
jgi:transcriptional regulator GlxA family with amidase domain